MESRRNFLTSLGLAAGGTMLAGILSSCSSKEEKVFATQDRIGLYSNTDGDGDSYIYYYPLALVKAVLEKDTSLTPEEIAKAYGLEFAPYDRFSEQPEPVIGFSKNTIEVKYNNYPVLINDVRKHILPAEHELAKKVDNKLDLQATPGAKMLLLDLTARKTRIYLPAEAIYLLADNTAGNSMEFTDAISKKFPGAGLLPNSTGKIFIITEKDGEFTLTKPTIEQVRAQFVLAGKPGPKK